MNKNTKKILIIALVVVVSILFYKRVVKSLNIYPFSEKINVKKGEAFEIDFGKYSPSSGQWWILSNRDSLSLVTDNGQQYPESEKENLRFGLVGGSVNMRWRFTANKKGTEILKFVFPRLDRVEKTREVVVNID